MRAAAATVVSSATAALPASSDVRLLVSAGPPASGCGTPCAFLLLPQLPRSGRAARRMKLLGRANESRQTQDNIVPPVSREITALAVMTARPVRTNACVVCAAIQRLVSCLLADPRGVQVQSSAGASATRMRGKSGGGIDISITTAPAAAIVITVGVSLLTVIGPSSATPFVSSIVAAVAAVPATARRCPEVNTIVVRVAAVAAMDPPPVIAPVDKLIGTVVSIGATITSVMFSAIGTTAIVIQHDPSAVPLPPPIGSLPLVLVASLADGAVSCGKRFPDDTLGGDNGAGGVPDERGAAASARTTTCAPVPSDAMPTVRSVIPPPPLTAVFSCAADDGARNVGTNNEIGIISVCISSLLRDGDSTAASSSNKSGRRRSSGPHASVGHSLDSLSQLPPAVGQPRATLHRRCRRAAEAIPEASAMVPRAAPAPLLPSSIFLQREEAGVTGRAGHRRGAWNRNSACGVDDAGAATTACHASAAGGRRGCTAEDGGDEVQCGKEAAHAPRPGSPWPTPRGPLGPTAANIPWVHQPPRWLPGR